jgi:hypothetical protein
MALRAFRILSVLSLVAAVGSGCSTHNLRTYGAVDSSNKTITVPPGGGLTGAVKDVLVQDGWKITVYRGPELLRGTTGDTTRLERGGTFTTRYALFLRWQQFDICIPRFDPAYTYDISLVDNQDGSEVLTLSGRGCEGRIIDAFSEGLRSRPHKK